MWFVHPWDSILPSKGRKCCFLLAGTANHQKGPTQREREMKALPFLLFCWAFQKTRISSLGHIAKNIKIKGGSSVGVGEEIISK